MSTAIVAQNKAIEWQLGYFAPYLSNTGSTVGCSFNLKDLQVGSPEQKKSKQRLQCSAQLGYFTQTNVSKNIFFNPELVYKWNKQDKRIFLTSSVGAGYLIEFQKQDGKLNLQTAETSYKYKPLNNFLPNLNFGFGVDPKKQIGFYLKGTYGSKIRNQNTNAAFVGFATGLIFKFNTKN